MQSDSTENKEEDAEEAQEPFTEKKKRGIISTFLEDTFPFIILAAMALAITNKVFYGDELFEKKSLIKDIEQLITNGADLRAIRHQYKNRTLVTSGILSSISSGNGDYLPYNTPLSDILEEIRTNIFLSGTSNKDTLLRIDEIIDTYNSSNPFDKLESGQKDLFENIRVKLSSDYSTVSSDINKLSDELHNKNLLVNEYLADSKTSLFVSIGSALMAVILAGIQIYQNNKRHKLREKNIDGYTRPFTRHTDTIGGKKYRIYRDRDGKIIRKIEIPPTPGP